MNFNNVEQMGQTALWRFRREDSVASIMEQLKETMDMLGSKPFVFLIDLCGIRYILPDDKNTILQAIQMIQHYPMIELSYVVNHRSYDRLRLLISLNQLPCEDRVFHSEADALGYLDGVMKKHCKKNKRIVSVS